MLRACIIKQRRSWDRYMLLVEFAYNKSHYTSIDMAPYEALYRWKCQSPSCWYEPRKMSLSGPYLVRWTTEQVKKIWHKVLTAQSCQKSYADTRRKPLEFQEGDHVFLKITLTTRISRAVKVKKLSPWFINPFQILKRIRPVAYQVALPPHLSKLHDAFRVTT